MLSWDLGVNRFKSILQVTDSEVGSVVQAGSVVVHSYTSSG